MVKIQNLALDKLTFWDKNPRFISDQQMKKLKKSLKEDPYFLNMRPILVNYSEDIYLIYAGNQRARAAISLGMKEIPCIVEENVPEKLMQQRSIKDNKTYGDWDYEMLGNEWDAEFLLDCGFTENDLGFGDEAKDLQKKFKIILEFDNEDEMEKVLPELNKLRSLCQVKVKK